MTLEKSKNEGFDFWMDFLETNATGRAGEFAEGSAVFLETDFIGVREDLLVDAVLSGRGEVHFADLGRERGEVSFLRIVLHSFGLF